MRIERNIKIFVARIYKEDMALIRIKDLLCIYIEEAHFLAASRSSTDNFHPLYLYILRFFEFSTISNDFSSIARRIKMDILSRRTRANDVPSRISLDYYVKLRKEKRIDLIDVFKVIRERGSKFSIGMH